jgi:pimeloyl-ACP methyl ester carboxylesterase
MICVLVIAGSVFANASASARTLPTVVLVHGAFADQTSWYPVASELRNRGYAVTTVDNPLRGPGYDAATVQRTLDTITGPIVLVGHSYGGVVITNVHDRQVRANVYIAAFAPAQGEFVQGLINPISFPGSQLLPPALELKVVDDPTVFGGKNVDGYIAQPYFRNVFAQDVSATTAADMFAHQKSAALWANLEPSGSPSWARTPSWYLISEQDRVIPPASQRFMASRAAPAHTQSIQASHVSLISQPVRVADTIVEAANSVG